MTKRELIINQAYELFAEKGNVLSLSEVTAAAGLQKQSIYNYYKSKDELIQAMLEREVEDYSSAIEAMEKQIAEQPVLERLKQMMKFNVCYFEDRKKLKVRRWLSMLQEQESLTPIIEKVKALEISFYNMIKRDMAEAIEQKLIRSDNIEISTMGLIVYTRGIIDGLLVLSTGSAYEQMIHELIEAYWNSIT